MIYIIMHALGKIISLSRQKKSPPAENDAMESIESVMYPWALNFVCLLFPVAKKSNNWDESG